jgi:hypothetical protein
MKQFHIYMNIIYIYYNLGKLENTVNNPQENIKINVAT